MPGEAALCVLAELERQKKRKKKKTALWQPPRPLDGRATVYEDVIGAVVSGGRLCQQQEKQGEKMNLAVQLEQVWEKTTNLTGVTLVCGQGEFTGNAVLLFTKRIQSRKDNAGSD